MRRKWVLGVGLAGLLTGSTAAGQFGGNQVPGGMPPRPAPAGSGFQPAVGGYVPPTGGLNPAVGYAPPGGIVPASGLSPATPTPAEIEAQVPRALPPDHPWALRPETGPWFICVKSYSRPANPDPSDPGMTALQLAVTLATEIRDTYKVQAWLFEYISEEKRCQAEAKARALKEREVFRAAESQIAQRSQLQGMQFLDQERVIRYKTFAYRDQIAVLVGPFQSEDDALKAAGVMRSKWPAPKDTRLMDGAIVKPPPGSKEEVEKTYLNPYKQPMVVENPAVHKVRQPVAADRVDDFVRKLNEGRPYNLLMAKKGWTLAVKSYGAPVTIQTRDEEPAVAKRMGTSSGADVLAAGAGQAEQLAKALREMKGPGGQPLNLEAFVLHTRGGSVVTVGQFDGPNDPALIETRRVLSSLTFNVSKDATGAGMMGTSQRLFGDNILPMPIPKP